MQPLCHHPPARRKTPYFGSGQVAPELCQEWGDRARDGRLGIALPSSFDVCEPTSMPAQPLATPAPSSEPTNDGRCALQRRQPIAESDYDCFAKRIKVNHEHVASPMGLKVDSAACGDPPDAGGTHRNACEQIYCFDWPDVLYRSVATDETPCIRQDAASSRSNSPISRSASPRHRL